MKVRFEIEVENTEVFKCMPPSTDEVFRGADGKNFLVRDPLTGNLTIVACNKGIDDEHKYPEVWHLVLPLNARIVDAEDEGEDPIVGVKSLMANYHESITKQISESYKGLFNMLEQKEPIIHTEGISENTLLEALRIVSKKEE